MTISIEATTDQAAASPLATSPLLAGPRPAPAGAMAASLAFAWRSVLKVRHAPEQSLDVVAIPVVFTVMFTYLFGGALAGSTGDYLRFLLPGTLVMTVLLLTMYTGVVLSTDRATGTLDRFRSLPIWRPAPIVGALLGDLGRYLIASSLVLVLGVAMGFRAAGGVAGVLASLALILVFCSATSWMWTTLGLLVRTPTSLMNLGVVVLFPLTLASNVFVDPATTPQWLQAFIRANPVTHLVSAVRSLMLDTPDGGEIAWALVATIVLTAVFAPLTMRLYRNQGR
jgi:ABC-2 type transport system permease protein